MELFPAAPIYTLLYDEERTMGRFAGRVKKTAFLDWPFVRKQHRPFIPLMPLAAASLRLGEDYDLVVSDNAGYAKGVRVPERAFHLSYCHTPLRYAWETEDYFTGALFKTAFSPVFRYLRAWDYRSAQRPHQLLANSRFIAQKIKQYYGREAPVVHPPVDLHQFYYDPAVREGEYFLAAGRLLHYKRFDLIVDAFHLLKLPLKIVGSGPGESALRERIGASEHIELIPFIQNEEELRLLYNGARAFVFPQVEDFGLVAAEAQACGTPVVAFAEGGALEIVEDGINGILFHEQTAAALAAAVHRFCARSFNRPFVGRCAERFGRTQFRDRFLAYLPAELRSRLG